MGFIKNLIEFITANGIFDRIHKGLGRIHKEPQMAFLIGSIQNLIGPIKKLIGIITANDIFYRIHKELVTVQLQKQGIQGEVAQGMAASDAMYMRSTICSIMPHHSMEAMHSQ
jgi:hypothetical protein